MCFFGKPSFLFQAWEAFPVSTKVFVNFKCDVPIFVHSFHLFEKFDHVAEFLIDVYQFLELKKDRKKE